MQIALGSINLLLGAIIPPMGIKIISLVLILFSTVNIESRPISYSGGSTLMLLSNSLSDSIYYHYSPTYKYSMGVEFVKNKPLINIIIFFMALKGVFEKRGHYEMVEKVGLYWHFIDLVWVFVFTFFYLI